MNTFHNKTSNSNGEQYSHIIQISLTIKGAVVVVIVW